MYGFENCDSRLGGLAYFASYAYLMDKLLLILLQLYGLLCSYRIYFWFLVSSIFLVQYIDNTNRTDFDIFGVKATTIFCHESEIAKI